MLTNVLIIFMFLSYSLFFIFSTILLSSQINVTRYPQVFLVLFLVLDPDQSSLYVLDPPPLPSLSISPLPFCSNCWEPLSGVLLVVVYKNLLQGWIVNWRRKVFYHYAHTLLHCSDWVGSRFLTRVGYSS